MILGGGTPPPYQFPSDRTRIARAEHPTGIHWTTEVGIQPDAPLGNFDSLKTAIKAAKSISRGSSDGVAVMEAKEGQFELFRAGFYEDLMGTNNGLIDFEAVGRSKVEGPFFNRRYTGWSAHTFERVGEAGQALRALVDGPVVVEPR